MHATTLPAGKVTAFQSRVYDLLLQIPEGKVSTYAALARALESSPRAIGGALRRNPFAPEVPCHRFIGGFKGDWEKAPSGVNQAKKRELLTAEGVQFDKDGYLMDASCWWDEFRTGVL
ncbi:hypothetical protein N0V90_013336 [Kalmusia sp. IMI 367209]|nr:hypothetical protein N0V90_013336 [Kalmusia sp. IMI 367209]